MSARVLAGVSSDDRAAQIRAFARELGRVLSAQVDAVHVGGPAVFFPPGVRSVTGEPVAVLTREAAAPDVVAVVLGRSAEPSHQPIGRVAYRLLATLSKPVTVVPQGAPHPERLGRVLVPLEGTRSSSLAPKRMIDIAATSGLDVLLLHVFDPETLPMFTDQPQHETEAWTREFLARYSPYPPESARLQTCVGSVEEEVVRAARGVDADLVVLGWSQQLSAGRAPVVRAALESAHVPVMLIPVLETEKQLNHDRSAAVAIGAAGAQDDPAMP
jgi:nucleotide-binding universal stress UspA family protein